MCSKSHTNYSTHLILRYSRQTEYYDILKRIYTTKIQPHIKSPRVHIQCNHTVKWITGCGCHFRVKCWKWHSAENSILKYVRHSSSTGIYCMPIWCLDNQSTTLADALRDGTSLMDSITTWQLHNFNLPAADFISSLSAQMQVKHIQWINKLISQVWTQSFNEAETCYKNDTSEVNATY